MAKPRSAGEEQAHGDRSRSGYDGQHLALANPEDNAHYSSAAAEESEEPRHDPVSDCEGLSTQHSGAKEKGALSKTSRFSRVSGGHAAQPTPRFTGAARSILDNSDELRSAASGAIASWAASHRACGYDSSDVAVGGHAPIRCRNATILPR